MEFKSLVQLVKVLKNKKKDKTPSKNSDQTAELVGLLQDTISASKDISEEEAFEALKNKDSGLSIEGYKILEKKLVGQLLDSTLLEAAEPTKLNSRQADLANGYRDFATANALFANGANLAAIEILETLLHQSIKKEFTNLSVDITRILKSRYSIIGEGKKVERYTKLNQIYEEKRRLENLAMDRFEAIQDQYVYKKTPIQQLYPAAAAAYAELHPLARDCNTSLFHFFVCEIGIMQYMAKNDCNSIIHLVDTNLHQLKTSSRNNSFLLGLYWQKLTCLIQLQIHEPGDHTAKSFLKLCEQGSFNWFKGLEAYFYYCMHTKRYQDALKIYAQMVRHPRIKEMPSEFRDSCYVLKGYLYLLGKLGKIETKKIVAIADTFDVRSYAIKYQTTFIRNSGFAIPFSILCSLLNWLEMKSKDLAESNNSLKACRRRYLNKDKDRRSLAFVDLLLAIPNSKRGFQDPKFKKELDILAAEKPPRPEQIFGMEIIPYEDLFEMLSLHILANKTE